MLTNQTQDQQLSIMRPSISAQSEIQTTFIMESKVIIFHSLKMHSRVSVFSL